MHPHSSINRVSRRLNILASATVAVSFTAAYASVPPPTTRPVTWNNAGGDSAYVNPANWNPALSSAPANADNEFLTINNGGTALINPGDNAEGAFINIGLTPGDTGTLLITGGTLTVGELRVGGRETLPASLTDWGAGTAGNGGGTGTVVQSGSSVVNVNFTFGNDPDTGNNYEPPVQSMYVGDSGLASGNTANGSYTIKDNAVLLNGLQTNDQLVIGTGAGTHGTFTQQDNSSVTSTGTLIVGRRGATGSYSISGGTLSVAANTLSIGDGDSTTDPTTVGLFTQTGGTVIAKNLALGRRGGTGTYSLSAGTLQNPDGVSAEFDIGVGGGNGVFNLSDTGVVQCFNFYIGGNASSIGNNASLNMTGGSLTTTNLVLSATALATGSSTRTLNMSGGTLTTTSFNQSTISSPSVTRSATISGGTFTVTGTTTAGKNVAYGLSGGAISFNTFNLDNSTLNISNSANVSFANYNLAGNMGGSTTISGGTVNVTGNWRINNNATTPPGSLTITGGNVTMASIITGGTAALLNISGGNLSIASLTLSNGTVFTTDNNISLNSSIILGSTASAGTTTINVNTGSLALTGPLSNTPAFTLNKTGPGSLTLSGTQTHTGAATYSVSAGTLNLNADGGSNATLNTIGGTTNFGASQNLAAVNVSDGATTALTADGTHTLTTPSLNLNNSGTLDLANNSLIIPDSGSTSFPTLLGYLHSGYNNGAWNGAGINSSTAQARADHATGIGYSDNGSQLQTVYTWMGDLNLDGKLNADDYVLLDQQVAKHGLGSSAVWTTGDLNYDGIVTSADYLVIDTAFGHQMGSLSPDFLAAREAEFGPHYIAQLTAAVPEPSTLSLVGIASVALLRRRRNILTHPCENYN